MSDITGLERQILDAVRNAGDEAALEGVRVAALGKKGSVSELLKSLGAMSPEERKTKGPQINGLRDRVAEAIAARKSVLETEKLNARLAFERIDVTLPARRMQSSRIPFRVGDEEIEIGASPVPMIESSTN